MKKFDEMTQDELDEFEQDKEKVYEEQIKLTKEREENIAGRKGKGEMTHEQEGMEAERLLWEAQAMKDIREGVTEDSKELLEGFI